jgi:hypothetical protein
MRPPANVCWEHNRTVPSILGSAAEFGLSHAQGNAVARRARSRCSLCTEVGVGQAVGRYEGDQGVPDGLSFRQLKAEIVLHCVLGRRVP